MESIRNQVARAASKSLYWCSFVSIRGKNKNRDDTTHPAIQNLRQRIWIAGGATS
jgi:hypothetical protein